MLIPSYTHCTATLVKGQENRGKELLQYVQVTSRRPIRRDHAAVI